MAAPSKPNIFERALSRPEVSEPSFVKLEEVGSSRLPQAGEGGEGVGVPPPSEQHSLFYTTVSHINFMASLVIVSAPFFFALSGWLGGFILCLVYLVIMTLSAKWVCQAVEWAGKGTNEWPASSLPDLVRIVFGSDVAYWIVWTTFFLELFGDNVSAIMLISDQLQLLVPQFSTLAIKAMILPALFFFSFIPWRRLHFATVLGVLCMVFILFAIYFEGFTRNKGPGSVWDPAPTFLLPSPSVDAFKSVAVASGIVIHAQAGVSPLSVMYIGMKQRVRNRNREVIMAFSGSMVLFLLSGVAGYLAWGEGAKDMITKNLSTLPDRQVINEIVTIALIIIPFTNLSTATEPLVLDLEALIERWLRRNQSTAPRATSTSGGVVSHGTNVNTPRKRSWGRHLVVRLIVTSITILVAMALPSFSFALALVGGTVITVNCIIAPAACVHSLYRARKGAESNFSTLEVVIARLFLLVGLFLAFFTTIGTLMSGSAH